MPPRTPRRVRDDRGQASVEFVALLPILIIVVAALYQLVLAGEAIWAARVAAGAAARAQAIGTDPTDAALAHLPDRLEHGLRVSTGSDGGVRVSLRIPDVVPGVHLGHTAARSHFEPQTG